MKRFIFISFGFLALAFFEMSGGTAFDPVEARSAAVAARSEADATVADSTVESPRAAVEASPGDGPTITRLSLNLASLDDVLNPVVEVEEPTRAILSKPVEQTPTTTAVPATQSVDATAVTFDATAEPQVILPSIIFPGSTSSASSERVSSGRDTRVVSAAIVNMRGGPGTGFEVVAKLNRDTQVEILQDNGAGWVKLRPIAGGPEGWIADYLLDNG